MGARYLTDLADVCRRTGRPVVQVDGWQYRARGSGGYDGGRPNHVMVHHTASGPESDGWDDVNYCTYGDEDAPLCNLYLARDGTIYVCAAGGTNTNGSGSDPCGLINDDAMNSSAIGVEAGNDGVGEPWPERQQDAYVALCDALCAAYGIGVVQVHGHAEWTSRKIDPAGPSRYAWDDGTWDMDEFREDVGLGSIPPEPAPGPTPTPPQEGDDDMPTFIIQNTTNGENALVYGDGKVTGIADPDLAKFVERFGWPLPVQPEVFDDFASKGSE
jgi:hypothetical protein